MCLGERRQLVVPPKLAYGARGAGSSVPPGATLRFEIEAVGINNHKLPSAAPTPLPNVFAQMDLNPMDGRISWDEMERWYQQEHPERLSTIPRGVFEMQDKNGVSSLAVDRYALLTIAAWECHHTFCDMSFVLLMLSM